MVTHGVDHECTDCGNVQALHQFDHEEDGDVVEAWCTECKEDTPHIIGGDDEPERLDNPAWKDRMRPDGGSDR